jgi:hypothetical protein
MPQRRAVQLYTGNHWHVEAAILAEVQHFTTFAVRAHPSPADMAMDVWPLRNSRRHAALLIQAVFNYLGHMQ